ncbi:MAG: hypothetical protein RIC82_10100, partial [Parvibaculum sp.]
SKKDIGIYARSIYGRTDYQDSGGPPGWGIRGAETHRGREAPEVFVSDIGFLGMVDGEHPLCLFLET